MSEIEKNPRQCIIETALRLFYQQGFRATGINQIIAESNVAKATFNSHFPSKEQLCVAIDRLAQKYPRRLRQHLLAKGDHGTGVYYRLRCLGAIKK